LRELTYSLAVLRVTMLPCKSSCMGHGRPGEEDRLLSAQSDTEAYYGRIAKARQLSAGAVGNRQSTPKFRKQRRNES